MSEAKLPVNNNLNNRKDSNFSASKLIKENGMLIALVAVVVIFQILTKGIMLKPLNITNLIQQNGYILILAVGMLLVVIIGTVDLAVGAESSIGNYYCFSYWNDSRCNSRLLDCIQGDSWICCNLSRAINI